MIASKELRQRLEVSGYGGYEFRGSPDAFEIPGGAFRWGAGAGFPTRTPLRGVLEINGLLPSDDVATLTGAQLIAIDGSISPLVSATENITRMTAGATWQGRNGFFVGGGVSWNVPMQSRDGFSTDSNGVSQRLLRLAGAASAITRACASTCRRRRRRPRRRRRRRPRRPTGRRP